MELFFLDADLAPGWAELIDTDSRTPYFWNTTTGETTWVRPVAPPPSEPKTSEAEEEKKKEEEDKIDMDEVRACMIICQYCRFPNVEIAPLRVQHLSMSAIFPRPL